MMAAYVCTVKEKTDQIIAEIYTKKENIPLNKPLDFTFSQNSIETNCVSWGLQH